MNVCRTLSARGHFELISIIENPRFHPQKIVQFVRLSCRKLVDQGKLTSTTAVTRERHDEKLKTWWSSPWYAVDEVQIAYSVDLIYTYLYHMLDRFPFLSTCIYQDKFDQNLTPRRPYFSSVNDNSSMEKSCDMVILFKAYPLVD